MELDPKLAQKVLDADLANMAQRVRDGRTLTANQRAHFMQVTGQMPLPATGLAKNKVELAAILGIARQTIYKWQKLDDAPKPNADGTHNIADWLAFIRLRNLKGAEEDGGMDLRDRKMLGQCLKIEAELEILKGNWIPKHLVKQFMEDVFTACRSRILHSQMDNKAKDEVLNELTRLNDDPNLGLDKRDEGAEASLQSVVTSSEVDGD